MANADREALADRLDLDEARRGFNETMVSPNKPTDGFFTEVLGNFARYYVPRLFAEIDRLRGSLPIVVEGRLTEGVITRIDSALGSDAPWDEAMVAEIRATLLAARRAVCAAATEIHVERSRGYVKPAPVDRTNARCRERRRPA
jgi:hypothetical protein